MATTTGTADPGLNKEYNNQIGSHDHANDGVNGTPGQRRFDYGGNPLAHTNTGDSARFAASEENSNQVSTDLLPTASSPIQLLWD